MENFSVKYNGHNVTLSGLENCSITQLMRDSGAFYEVELLEALMPYVSPGQCVVDIGAHIGNHTLFFTKVMGAHVLAMEANPKAFTLLKDNLKKNKLEGMASALNVAVSHNAEPVTLTPLSSNDPGTYSALRDKHTDNSFTCKAVTLDGTYDAYFQKRPPKLIKFDVEGAEAGILKAARKILVTYEPILATEVLTEAEFNAVAKVITPLGYHPVSLHNATPTIIWEFQNNDGPSEKVLSVFRYAVRKSAELNLLSVSNGKYKIQVGQLEEKIKILETKPVVTKSVEPKPKTPEVTQPDAASPKAGSSKDSTSKVKAAEIKPSTAPSAAKVKSQAKTKTGPKKVVKSPPMANPTNK